MQSLKNSSQISKQTSLEELEGEKVSIQLGSPKYKTFEIEGEAAIFTSKQVLTVAQGSQSQANSIICRLCASCSDTCTHRAVDKGLLSKGKSCLDGRMQDARVCFVQCYHI